MNEGKKLSKKEIEEINNAEHWFQCDDCRATEHVTDKEIGKMGWVEKHHVMLCDRCKDSSGPFQRGLDFIESKQE